MILTINPNAAVDKVMLIDEFRPGTSMRPDRVLLSIGGKALDSALVLQTLGAPVQALTFVAGENGRVLARLLEEKKIPTHLIWVDGDTRHTYVIVERALGRHSQLSIPGYTITGAERATFIEQVRRYAPGASWAVLAGSLPGGVGESFYRELIEVLHEQGIRTLLDAFGPPALEALRARPTVVKMNQSEFARTFGVGEPSVADAVPICREVIARYGLHTFVLTCGKQGLFAFTPERTLHAVGPVMKELNASGSGDAVSGVLPYRLSLGDTWERALQWATAAAAAVVITEGTAECHVEDIQRILPSVQVRSADAEMSFDPITTFVALPH